MRLVCAMLSVMFMLSGLLFDPALAAASRQPVEVTQRKEGNFDYVVGRVKIPAPPDRVWVVMANPYEFEQKISPKSHVEKVHQDTPDVSVITARIDCIFRPIHYTVESKYEHRRKITFHALSGDLRDFRGAWEITPADDGASCYVTFGMFVQPNLPIPQFLIRHAIRAELPHTLNALRERVEQLAAHGDKLATRKLASTGDARFD